MLPNASTYSWWWFKRKTESLKQQLFGVTTAIGNAYYLTVPVFTSACNAPLILTCINMSEKMLSLVGSYYTLSVRVQSMPTSSSAAPLLLVSPSVCQWLCLWLSDFSIIVFSSPPSFLSLPLFPSIFLIFVYCALSHLLPCYHSCDLNPRPFCKNLMTVWLKCEKQCKVWIIKHVSFWPPST